MARNGAFVTPAIGASTTGATGSSGPMRNMRSNGTERRRATPREFEAAEHPGPCRASTGSHPVRARHGPAGGRASGLEGQAEGGEGAGVERGRTVTAQPEPAGGGDHRGVVG